MQLLPAGDHLFKQRHEQTLPEATATVNAVANPTVLSDVELVFIKAGFQIGLSYQPDGGQGTLGDGNSADDGDDEDVFMIGGNWVDNIEGFDVGIGGAYSTAGLESGAPGPPAPDSDLHLLDFARERSRDGRQTRPPRYWA